ncbi:hypothetical protein EKK58_10095 [Candidatus Dependentiae bacterium]|nr:MAG: hypothetical protein EKK58_10095 [Candidatus Dependentiae bacterium]
MRLITSFTADPTQSISLVLDDGSKVNFTMRYISNQVGWFYSIEYGSFVVNNRRIVTSPNMLRAFRGIINFGIGVSTADGYEPIYIDDFSNGRASFYLLNEADVLAVEQAIKDR